MRMLSSLASIPLLLSLSLSACGSDSDDTTDYATLQACVDDLKSPEGGAIDTKGAIAMCLADKTFAGSKLSFTTKEECVTYVTANTVGFMPNAIATGCETYINGK